jgi:SAM-dependent methyltransferase
MLAHAFQTLATVFQAVRGSRWQVHPIDKKLGVETSARVARRAQLSGKEADKFALHYQGVQPSILRKCLDLISVSEAMTFIDIGCGKGRALIVAADYPFRKLIGIELSDFVLAKARANFNLLKKTNSRYADITLLQGDASNPPLDRGINVLAFVNSFTDDPIHALIENMRKHLEAFPESEIWLIAYNPVSFQEFDDSGFLKRYYAAKLDFEPDEAATAPNGNTYDSVIIYQSRGPRCRESLPGADAKVIITIPRLGAEIEQSA